MPSKTISTHNGSQANREHNIRNDKVIKSQDHIKKDLVKNNEILIDEKPRDAYKRIFGKALEEYNLKTREDRRIKDYYSHICKDNKKHPVYEMIVQIGDKNDTGVNAPLEKQIIKEFIADWKKRNPNLELIGAYIHSDEATIHAHLDYIPVATGYKKGLAIQNGLVKALGQQGFIKQGKETAQIQWEKRENQALEDICLKYGIEVNHPKRENVKHMSVERYKALQSVKSVKEDIYNLEANKKALEGQIKALEGRLLSADEVNRIKIKKTLMGSVKVEGASYEDLCNLKKTASFVEKLAKKFKEISAKNESLENELKQMQEQQSTLNKKEFIKEMERIDLQKKSKELEKLKNAIAKCSDNTKLEINSNMKTNNKMLNRDRER